MLLVISDPKSVPPNVRIIQNHLRDFLRSPSYELYPNPLGFETSNVQSFMQDLLAQTAVLKLNGGLGTSMGLEKAKSLLLVKDGKTFLDLIAEQIKYFREKYGSNVKFILVSPGLIFWHIHVILQVNTHPPHEGLLPATLDFACTSPGAAVHCSSHKQCQTRYTICDTAVKRLHIAQPWPLLCVAIFVLLPAKIPSCSNL
jgi:UTP--glucose-1-phosphate uridylyltransferase